MDHGSVLVLGKTRAKKKKPNQSQCMEIISQKWLKHVITLKAVHKPYMYMNTPTNFYVLNTHWAIELRSSYHKLNFSPQKILTHFCIKAWKCITCTRNHNKSTVDIKNTTFARAPPFFSLPVTSEMYRKLNLACSSTDCPPEGDNVLCLHVHYSDASIKCVIWKYLFCKGNQIHDYNFGIIRNMVIVIVYIPFLLFNL